MLKDDLVVARWVFRSGFQSLPCVAGLISPWCVAACVTFYSWTEILHRSCHFLCEFWRELCKVTEECFVSEVNASSHDWSLPQRCAKEDPFGCEPLHSPARCE